MSVANRARLRNARVPVFRVRLADLLEEEVRAARRALSGGEAALRGWIENFYPGHADRIAGEMLPLVLFYGRRIAAEALQEIGSEVEAPVDAFARQYAEGLAGRWTNDSVAQLRAVLRDEDAEDLEGIIGERLEEWEAARPQQVAEREATQAAGAFAKTAFLAAGVTRLIWRANADACPLCERMDGRVVEITRPFLDAGDSVEAEREGDRTEREGDRTELVADQRIGHPPLHGMGGRGGVCQCQVAAG